MRWTRARIEVCSVNENVLLSVEGLKVRYRTDDYLIHAVNGVSLQVEHGKTLGLVGETGAGKTTIAKSILRILPKKVGEITKGRSASTAYRCLICRKKRCAVSGATRYP